MAQPTSTLFAENEELVQGIKDAGGTRDFDLDFLENIGQVAESRIYHKGEIILREGDRNTSLFFLLSGSVGVYVSGERVSELKRRGDLIGEMSVISQQPVSATIRAEEDVELIAVPTLKLDALDPEAARRFSAAMDRIYANILTDKLTVTNEKAKQFEATNRALSEAKKHLEDLNNQLEQRVEQRTQDLLRKTEELRLSNQQLEHQNALLQTSLRKIEEFSGSKTLTFSKLSQLYHNTLVPLQQTIEDVRARMPAMPAKPAPGAQASGSLHQLLQRASRETQSVVEILEPMTQLYNQERALQSKRVLFIDPERKQQLVARLALGGSGVELDLAGSADQARGLIENKEFEIIFVDASLVAFGEELRRLQPSAQLVLITSSSFTQPPSGFNTLISRDPNDRTFTIKGIMTTAQKIINQDFFGFEKYLAWGVDVQSTLIERSNQRAELNEAMQTYFRSLGLRTSLLSRCETVAEELLMNAIYDAPHDDSGQALYNHLSRQQVVQLKESEQGFFRFACDGMLAAVSVSDPFGGLKLETLMRYLESCYKGLSLNDTGEEKKGGAGRGLHQIVENADLVIFNVKAGRRTEAIALFNLEAPKSEEARPPQVHFFYSA